MTVSSPRDILGISTIISDPNIDIKALEDRIIKGGNIEIEEEDNSKQYKHELEQLSKAYDIDDMPFSSIPEPKESIEEFSPKVDDEQLRFMTMEQKKQNHVDAVFKDFDEDKELEFDIDKEQERDDKNSLLEQIDTLRSTLVDDGIDIDSIPNVTRNDSIADIQNVYKILVLKNDRNRYCSFAEELILSAALGMEFLFDGKKDWFGRNPDLTGWSSTVRVKLRRMRYTTSTFVQEIMQEYHLSSGMRLALELIPSMILYTKQKNIAKNNSVVDDQDYNNAMNNLSSGLDS